MVHRFTGRRGPETNHWKGGRQKGGGRHHDHVTAPPGHPRKNQHGYVLEHLLVAEKALEKSLVLPHVVHHHTQDQLVICEDQAYHLLLHQRQRAYEACGHASWRKCWICKEYDDPKNLKLYKNRTSAYHATCFNNQRNRRKGELKHGS